MNWWPIISGNRKKRSSSERQQIPLCPPMQYYPLPQNSEGDDEKLYHENDVAAPIASGSFRTDGMVIIPCSTGTLGSISNGISRGLIERSADVILKEKRKLIVVPRETPLSLIHLRNMIRLTEAGGVVMPASPGFYHLPKSVNDLVDMIASRVLQHLGIESHIIKPWKG